MNRPRPLSLLLLLLFIVSPFAQADSNQRHEIDIKKYQFHPPEITIKQGDTVRWTNREKRQYHTVWFEPLGEEEPDYFFPGEFYERVFEQPGSYRYRCGPHPKMTGVIHVK
ncbi:MAG: cupredoxin domain-containing protein [Candidatus Polarisedimenticolaceae bacterium]|nr:cupredoxin domain-containing protein [Candidatus Polarisedimenticolaceae bacterium]